jgi:hypothetical protein
MSKNAPFSSPEAHAHRQKLILSAIVAASGLNFRIFEYALLLGFRLGNDDLSFEDRVVRMMSQGKSFSAAIQLLGDSFRCELDGFFAEKLISSAQQN